jgi:hypothetical protein
MAELASLVQSLPPTLAPLLAAANPALGPANLEAAVVAALASLLPKLPYCPTQLAPSAVVRAAFSVNAEAIASMNWQVPAISAIPVLSAGLPVCAFAAQMQASLSVNPVKLTPCGSGCDAAKIMRALDKPPVALPAVPPVPKLPNVQLPNILSRR